MKVTLSVVSNDEKSPLMRLTKASRLTQGKGKKSLVAAALASVLGLGGAGFAAQAATIGNDQWPDLTALGANSSQGQARAQMLNHTPRVMPRVQMNELRKRMGNIRAAEGDSGVWTRYNGGQFSGDGALETDFHMIQAGVDTMPSPDSARFGLALSYANAQAQDPLSSADTDSVSFSGYALWAAPTGLFADVIARMAKSDTDYRFGLHSAKLDHISLSTSVEVGWRFDVHRLAFIEPSAELTYTYTDATHFSLGNASHAIGSTDSLIARAGFLAGIRCPRGLADAYVRVATVHELLGDTSMVSTVSGTSHTFSTKGQDSWIEYALGVNYKFNPATYLYADVERTAGAQIEEDWRANLGVRYSF